MQETQQSITAWVKATFPGGDDFGPRRALRLLEEVVELCWCDGATKEDICKAVMKAIDDLKPGEFNDKLKVRLELADANILIKTIAGVRGYDLDDDTNAKMGINRERKWKAMGDGTGYHVKGI